MDLGPTLMELCDVEVYDGIQGVSLVPILNDPQASVREHVLVEEDFPELLASRMSAPAKTRTLVTKEARYTRNSDGHQMLFDKLEDPLERTELSRTDEPLRQKLMEEMTDAFISSADGARGAPSDPSYS